MVKLNRKTKFLLENLSFKSVFDMSKIEKLQESEKTEMSAEVARKIYEIAIVKMADIDFGDIPNSKGDVTAFSHYTTMKDALAVLEEAVGINHEIDIVKTALRNLESNNRAFTKAYMDNIQIIEHLYCLTVMACVHATSLLISSYMHFIKNPAGDYTYEISLKDTKKNKTMEAASMESLVKFNQVCLEGGIDKMVYSSSNFLGTDGGTVLAVSMVITFLVILVPVMRELIYQFYYMRTSFADYIDAHISLIELSHVNGDVPKESKVKQQKIVKHLQALSDKIKVQQKMGRDKAVKDIQKEKIDKNTINTEPMGGFSI
ncbi:MAG: hypothetical protein ACRC0G_07665 [Fusobacteriaceae bacterium]